MPGKGIRDNGCRMRPETDSSSLLERGAWRCCGRFGLSGGKTRVVSNSIPWEYQKVLRGRLDGGSSKSFPEGKKRATDLEDSSSNSRDNRAGRGKVNKKKKEWGKVS